MKAVKFLIKMVVWLVVVVAAIVLALPLWIGPVTKAVANKIGPDYTKTTVNLGIFGLNPYSGRLQLGDFQMGNPTGFSSEKSVTLGNFEVELDPMSLMSEVIHIKSIKINDVYASVEFKDGKNNFSVIGDNCKGGVKKGEGVKGEGEGVKGEEVKGEGEGGKKVVIDRLEIGGVMVQLGPIPLPVPPLTLTDIGKKSNGVTLAEAWQQISESVMKNAGVVGSGLMDMGDKAGGHAGKALKSAGKLVDKTLGGTGKVADKTLERAGKAVDKAAGLINGLLK